MGLLTPNPKIPFLELSNLENKLQQSLLIENMINNAGLQIGTISAQTRNVLIQPLQHETTLVPTSQILSTMIAKRVSHLTNTTHNYKLDTHQQPSYLLTDYNSVQCPQNVNSKFADTHVFGGHQDQHYNNES